MIHAPSVSPSAAVTARPPQHFLFASEPHHETRTYQESCNSCVFHGRPSGTWDVRLPGFVSAEKAADKPSRMHIRKLKRFTMCELGDAHKRHVGLFSALPHQRTARKAPPPYSIYVSSLGRSEHARRHYLGTTKVFLISYQQYCNC